MARLNLWQYEHLEDFLAVVFSTISSRSRILHVKILRYIRYRSVPENFLSFWEPWLKVCNCFFSLRNIYNCIEEIKREIVSIHALLHVQFVYLPMNDFFLSKSQNLAKAKPPKSITPTGLSTVQYVSSIYNKNIYSINPNPSKGEEQKIWSSVMYSISRIKKVSYTY